MPPTFVTTFSRGSTAGPGRSSPSIPGASAFSIDESATTSGTTVVPAQQVQAVVYADGDYLVALHTDSLTASGDQPIAQGTGVALALQQYQYLEPWSALPTHRSPPQSFITAPAVAPH